MLSGEKILSGETMLDSCQTRLPAIPHFLECPKVWQDTNETPQARLGDECLGLGMGILL